MKKIIGLILSFILLLGLVTGCSGNSNAGASQTGTSKAESGFDLSKPITVVSREDGSGTRGAFIELFGVQQKDASGKKVDLTTQEANITNSTEVMMTSVAGNMYAIGYVSLGSLNNTVKALSIDGAGASVDNIKNGSYKISRPFNIVTNGTVSDIAKDFISFIMSADGQAVIEKNGYISTPNTEKYSGSKPSGKIVVAGSSSVTPVMEKLKEAYVAINTNANVEIQQSDSTTGITSTINKICDIGMSSRELTDTETKSGITATKIATDGIAVIVNNSNPVNNLAKDDVKSIFTGEATNWTDIVD